MHACMVVVVVLDGGGGGRPWWCYCMLRDKVIGSSPTVSWKTVYIHISISGLLTTPRFGGLFDEQNNIISNSKNAAASRCRRSRPTCSRVAHN